ncbi:acyl-CoA synthetase (NDP forming) [Dysgonomonas sp. PFB1-18]|uniref:acetate--CoA ligase family protein n=1 Tax=unclassified Dysgonomonas TaxID=2630389 RepID=UPI002476641F|nr:MULTISPECIES: acetate--CoA ligase [unclassified Dysgonomonas]MDH6310825.1 acyl-CoA synthetase (NDP forming) [Dysgonomonas sp. PF1-14]MDH6340675.1 acyl-CoA synthetase (NDP forming) [Dysgonomonas sp. PF1-16]MDH6382218.1 acyl-CoA synthetase (NDP forming) [Dysgonomonas sp. PFB1-18]MDH6399645.1 acyl-CoA synthetase (NDP forming) [Dysgonomonas sp. PF1-23]
MNYQQLINPKSIVVVGASDNILKPGGSVLYNLTTGSFDRDLYVVNARGGTIQGVKAYTSIEEIPQTDLAIISVPASQCLHTVEYMAKEKGVKAFIVFSAGFSEESEEGAILEKKLLEIVNKAGVVMIGPNCSGFFNTIHQSIFTKPVPILDPQGVDIISSSGGTITYIIESAMRIGLRFNSAWSIGNAAQVGVEDILEHLDNEFDPQTSPKIKLLYLEKIADPDRFLHHSSSLINKGCKIAAIKSGSSASGSRAASSHTGAIASSDSAVEALFRKAGIIRCYSREELANVAAVLTLKKMKGRNMAIITQAGGPAVILTDALSKGNIDVPEMDKDMAAELKKHLLPGAAVSNPIDIIGTGTGEHMAYCIDFCEKHFKEIDGISVIYGNPGVSNVAEAYEMLDEKIKSSKLPIYPILPSVISATKEMDDFVKRGHVNFTDEYALANAVSKVALWTPPSVDKIEDVAVDIPRIRTIIEKVPNGYIDSDMIRELFDAAGIPQVQEMVTANKEEAIAFGQKIGYPIVAKCVGPLHKSDVGGVVLNIRSDEHLALEFDRLMKIPDTTSVMIQPMLSGQELFIGAKYEPTYGHIVLCGLGGIFVEILQDVASGLAPLSFHEATSMVQSLRAYKIIKGVRGQKGLNEKLFIEIIVRLSVMLRFAPEIKEMDINPLLANEEKVIAVDARIRVEK